MTQEEFRKLIEKYIAGTASPLEERIIDDFFRSQERKSKAPRDGLSEEMWANIETQIRNPHGPSPLTPGRRRIWVKSVLVSLVLVMLCLSTWYLFAYGWLATPDLITSTASRGQKSIITLSDGTRVYLNSSSSISYPVTFSGNEREVWLENEAFFEVARDEKRPFRIHSGNITTKVLGTSFNVNAFDKNNISVSVATGKVQVDIDEDTQSGTGNSVSVVLIPNQQAFYNSQRGLSTRSINIEEFIAWKNNTIFFDDASLQEVADILERWYNVTIQFENPDIAKCHVNGKYKTPTLRSVLESIQYMYGIKYEFKGENKIIFYGKGC
jgi:transmembrane sensor